MAGRKSRIDLDALKARKGARNRASIPREVLDALEQGLIETKVLVEWLAVDHEKLARHVLPAVGLRDETPRIVKETRANRDLGIMQRMHRIGMLLGRELEGRGDADTIFERLASHPSDIVRSWAVYAVKADGSLPLRKRLALAKRFAADPAMAVRECAWESVRPFFVDDVARAIELLTPWVRSRDANVRRCAVEASRPRGVWTMHLPTLKEQPEVGLPLLEPVRADLSRYVQNAVANWLNDASKSRPAWVEQLCSRWARESPTPETAYIVKRALRTIRKS